MKKKYHIVIFVFLLFTAASSARADTYIDDIVFNSQDVTETEVITSTVNTCNSVEITKTISEYVDLSQTIEINSKRTTEAGAEVYYKGVRVNVGTKIENEFNKKYGARQIKYTEEKVKFDKWWVNRLNVNIKRTGKQGKLKLSIKVLYLVIINTCP